MSMSTIKIGIIVPMSGTAGIYGPSCSSCIHLAVKKLNKEGGLLGKPIETTFIDGGQKPNIVADNIKMFVEHGFFDILIGLHDSDVRRAILENTTLTIPYIYTSPYEGNEKNPAMFMIGETPKQQLQDPIPWFIETLNAKKWYLLGNDYCWPHSLNASARHYINQHSQAELIGTHYVPFGTEDYSPYIDAMREAKADIVLFSLVGDDAISFNRQLYDTPDMGHTIRFGPLMEENTLLAIGSTASNEIYAATSYHTGLANAQNTVFLEEYKSAITQNGPMLTSLGESCYEALIFIKNISVTSNSLSLDSFAKASHGLAYNSPRGSVRMEHRHLVQDIHLLQAQDFHFQAIKSFDQVTPSD